MIDTIRDAIDVHHHIRRESRDWILPGVPKIKLRAPHRHSVAFSLENNSKSKGLAFFSDQPPRGLAKMCDALCAIRHAGTLYLLAVEVKTASKGYYSKQLANGKHFWCWLEALLKEHGHLRKNDLPRHVGLLIWQPRGKSVRKGTTTHAGTRLVKAKSASPFDLKFEARNINRIQLIEALKA